jgi:uncharacterized membrane protein
LAFVDVVVGFVDVIHVVKTAHVAHGAHVFHVGVGVGVVGGGDDVIDEVDAINVAVCTVLLHITSRLLRLTGARWRRKE